MVLDGFGTLSNFVRSLAKFIAGLISSFNGLEFKVVEQCMGNTGSRDDSWKPSGSNAVSL